MLDVLRRLARDSEGVAGLEYVFVFSLLGGAIVAYMKLGLKIGALLSGVATAIR